MLACQAIIILALLAISGVDPARSLGAMAALAVLVGVVSATQDIVIDAWRIEAAGPARAGAMAAAYQWGYRIAVILAGILPLVLSDVIGWGGSYALMAVLMLAGTAGVLAAPREADIVARPKDPEPVAARPGRDALEWAGRGGLVLAAAALLGSGLSGNPFLLRAPLSALGLEGLSGSLAGLWAAKPAGAIAQVVSALGGLALRLLQLGLARSPPLGATVAVDHPGVDVGTPSDRFTLSVVNQRAVHAAQVLRPEDESAILPIFRADRAVNHGDGRCLWTFCQ